MPRLSLRVKLLLSIFLVLAPTLGLLLYGFQVEQARRRAEVLNSLAQTGEAVAALADASFDDAIALAQTLASDPAVQSLDPAQVQPSLQQAIRAYPWVESAGAADAAGDVPVVVLREPGPASPRVTAAGRPYFEQVMATGAPALSEVIISRVTSRIVMVAAAPLPGPAGRPAGAAIVALKLDALGNRLGSVGLRPGQTIFLLDRTGRVAVHTMLPDLPWDQRDLSAPPEVQAALAGQFVQTADFRSPLSGDVRAAAFVPTSKHGWVVVVTWPVAQAFGPLEAASRLQLLAFGAIALAAVIGTVLLSGYLVGPVERLGTQARALAWGEMGSRVDIRTGDELEALGQVFNTMAVQLESSLRQLAQARDEAEDERARLQAVLESAANGIFFLETKTGRLLANPEANQLFGRLLDPEAGRAQYVKQVSHPDGRPLALEELPSSRALSGQAVQDEELLVARPDGRTLSVLASAAPVRDPAGTVIGVVEVFQDISALKELERLREEWTSVIAHDLRQPVTVITGYAGLLAKLSERRAVVPQEQQAVEHIHASARQLSRMIADLLDVSRIEAGRLALERQAVDLAALVGEVVERAAEVTRGHPVRVEAQGSLPLLEADPGRIEQVLGNLLSNAAKYGDPETEIRVEVARRKAQVELAVTNQGPGIPSEDMLHLFTRFYRTRQARAERAAGLGLGLYISKGLVEAHGGRLWAESVPGRRTTFRFTLPIVATRHSPLSAG